MRLTMGAILATGAIALIWYVLWRVVRGVESWFVASGAGDALMWSLVACLIVLAWGLTLAAVAGAAGLAARAWVLRLSVGQRVESLAGALRPSLPTDQGDQAPMVLLEREEAQ